MRLKLIGIAAGATLALAAFTGAASADPDKANLGKSCDHISDQGMAHSASHKGQCTTVIVNTAK